jgi:hypothetical protein
MTQLQELPELYNPVYGLWNARAQQAQIKLVMEAAGAWLQRYVLAGSCTDSQRRPLIREYTAVRKSKLAFNTKKLQKDHPTLYQQCRPLIQRFQVSNVLLTAERGDYGDPLPRVPDVYTLDELRAAGVTAADAHAVIMALRPVKLSWKRYEDECKAQADLAAQEFMATGWTGEKHRFDDGWSFGCRQRWFKTDLAVVILPAGIVDQYSFMTPEKEVHVIRPIDPNRPHEDLEGDVEPDEGD